MSILTSDRPFIFSQQSDRTQPKVNNQRSPFHFPIKQRSPLTKYPKTAIAPSYKAIANCL
jgi:hypothetical protein